MRVMLAAGADVGDPLLEALLLDDVPARLRDISQIETVAAVTSVPVVAH